MIVITYKNIEFISALDDENDAFEQMKEVVVQMPKNLELQWDFVNEEYTTNEGPIDISFVDDCIVRAK